MFGALRRILSTRTRTTGAKAPQLESLEDRTVPATFNVTNLNDSGLGSLRDAVAKADANPGADQITFDYGMTGTIALTTGEIAIHEGVTIIGGGAGSVTISGSHHSRIFNVDLASGDSAIIAGLTLADGQDTTGGAILTRDGNLSLSSMLIHNNTAADGGGIAMIGNGNVLIAGSSIDGNTATNSGGGIYQSAGTVTLRDSSASSNTTNGAAGGGVEVAGGAFGSLRSTISLNTAGGSGGGIDVAAGGKASVINSTISDNTAKTAGGGGMSISGVASVENSTIADNVDAGGKGGGGVRVMTGGTFAPFSTIVGDNTSKGVGADVQGVVASGGYNLFESTIGGSGYASTDITDADPRLGPLSDNGGYTKTRLLLLGSPAIGAGAASSDVTGDQRNYNRTVNGKVDIGAVHYDSTSPTAKLTVAPDITSRNNNGDYQIRVMYADDQEIRLNKFTGQEVRIVGPNGFNQIAKAYAITQTQDKPDNEFTYKITPPKGDMWTAADNGTYQIILQPNAAVDGQGNSTPSGVLGSFTVNVQDMGGFVHTLYRTVLGRDPDAASLAAYQDRINRGESRESIAAEVWNSTEHRQLQVATTYSAFLGAAVDLTTLNSWIQAFKTGATESDVAISVLASSNFRSLYATNGDYVDAIYQKVLGRKADDAGRQTYVDQLDSGRLSDQDFVTQLVRSDEGKAAQVTAYYHSLMGRDPDSYDVAGYSSAMGGKGFTATTLASQLLGSDEFYGYSGKKA